MKHRALKRRICLTLVNKVFSGTHSFKIKRRLLRAAGMKIASDVSVVGPLFTTARLEIGIGSWIGRNLVIHGNGVVVIGENCDIAPDVTLLTGTHIIGGHKRRAGRGQTGNITIGDGCWIGARATILPGTTVGNGSVISACACVVNDVAEDVVAGGVPAKVIRKL